MQVAGIHRNLFVPLINRIAFTILFIYTLLQLAAFLPRYFATDGLHFERYVIAALVLAKSYKAHRHLRWRGWYWQGLLLVAPGSVIVTLASSHLPSDALAMYGFFLYILGLDYLCFGGASGRRTAMLLAGAAVLIFPPHAVVGPAFAGLRSLGFQTAAIATRTIFPDVNFQNFMISIRGRAVAYEDSCSGSQFLMTYAALCLVMLAGNVRWRRTLGELTLALGLGFLLNTMRVLTMIAMTRAGYGQAALVTRHTLIGEVFIFIGILILIWRSESVTNAYGCNAASSRAIAPRIQG